MNIAIKTINHKEQRYETLGDWLFTPEGDLEIRVSKVGNWKWEFIIALHELVEVMLCKSRGITQKQVDDFDMSPYGLGLDEPGDDPQAPYYQEHFFATIIEKMMAHEMELDWRVYDYYKNIVE